jgi:hypothetical protein
VHPGYGEPDLRILELEHDFELREPECVFVDEVLRTHPDDGVEVHLDAPQGLGRYVDAPRWFEDVEQVRVTSAPGYVDWSLARGVAEPPPRAIFDQAGDNLDGSAAVRRLV